MILIWPPGWHCSRSSLGAQGEPVTALATGQQVVYLSPWPLWTHVPTEARMRWDSSVRLPQAERSSQFCECHVVYVHVCQGFCQILCMKRSARQAH